MVFAGNSYSSRSHVEAESEPFVSVSRYVMKLSPRSCHFTLRYRTGLGGHGASNQPVRLVSNSFLPARYLESLEEVVDDNIVDNTGYSLSRDLVDSFSGYSSLLSWNHEDVSELLAIIHGY